MLVLFSTHFSIVINTEKDKFRGIECQTCLRDNHKKYQMPLQKSVNLRLLGKTNLYAGSSKINFFSFLFQIKILEPAT